jgi:hypothetical protein
MSALPSSAEHAFDLIVTSTASEDVHEATMFGCGTLLEDDKIFACLYHDGLAVRLGEGSSEFESAMSLPGSTVWDPTRRDKPFRDWALLPLAAKESWTTLAVAALRRLRRA